MNGALVRLTYPRAMLGRGIGYNGLVVAAAAALGPSLASATLALASWRWLFAINLPLGTVALLISARFVPRTAPAAWRLDIVSAILTAAAFAAFFVTGSDLAHGVLGRRVAMEIALTLAIATILVRRSRHQVEPLLPLDLLRTPILRLSYLASIGAFGAQMMVLIALPFYLERALGFGHVATGLLITPMPAGIAVAAPGAGGGGARGAGAGRGGLGRVRPPLGVGARAAIPASRPLLVIIPAMLLAGLGFGLFQTPNNRVMLGRAPSHRGGAAGGMLAVSRVCGFTCGAIVVAFTFRLGGPASVLPMVIASGATLLAAGLSLSRLRAV